jgi:DNA-binding GntR family transcriptional regulator
VSAGENASGARAPERHGIGEPAEPLNSRTAYTVIKGRILDNIYAPNVTVSVQELALELRMSRTPIREALIRLEEEGLVALVPRHGFRVLPIAADEMLNVYEILAGLEAAAIELLIGRGLADHEIDALRSCVADLEEALQHDDLDRWARADAAFHRMLVGLSGNSRLIATVNQFMEQTTRARAITLRLRPRPNMSTRSHADLVEAIAARDSTNAREIHWSQRLRSARELAGILKQFNLRHL